MQNPPAYNTILREIFPYTSDQIINDVIQLVEGENPADSFEGKIENMINLLSGDGAQGPMPQIIQQQQPPAAAAPEEMFNGDLYDNLMAIFPDANPVYVLDYCREKEEGFDLNEAVDEFQEEGYQKTEVDPLQIWDLLKSTLPDADPSYLRKEADRLVHLDSDELQHFVQNAFDKHDYPTMQEYKKRMEKEEERSPYINFDIDKFLEVFPNPIETFMDPSRKLPLDENSNEVDVNYSLVFLYNHYRFIRKVNIKQVFEWNNRNLLKICDQLDRITTNMRRARPFERSEETQNVALLQEIAFVKHRKKIKKVLKMRDDYYRLAKEEARKYGFLETCQCCFDEEVIPEECFFCLKGCTFCKDCVKCGIETKIAEGELRFPCFVNCDSEFSLQTIQMVLPKTAFRILTQKIASEEIKKANVDGLEVCPFCNFAMVLPDDEKIFKCINDGCEIESCRECRHKSHIPLRCDEIEYDEDVRRRTYIENKMTEALTRTCANCKKTFIKTDGCNKMTCSCGAKMCYLCGASITDYSHFQLGRCILFTNDREVNLERILRNADQAKQELGGDIKIKFDPTRDIQDYYR